MNVFLSNRFATLRLSSSHFFVLIAICCLAPSSWCTDSLARSVTIYRDNFGVPHIVGETEQAAFFGYGYAQAEDHLEQMMLQYRDAQGRRAEVLGVSALGKRLEFEQHQYRWGGDYLQRLLRAKEDVVENRDKIDRNTYQVLSAFARGVNEYIAEHRSQIPEWIDFITPEDVEALQRSDYLRFYSIHDAVQKLDRKPYKFAAFGSNQWAISPFRSANGRVMHVESTHMPWDNRFQNYEAHLIVPGKLNVAGISWFGSPFFLDGFNDKITWSATWNCPNISDIYVEKMNPNGSMEYLYRGAWHPVIVRWEDFRVKSAQGMQTITLPLYYTQHGPIVRLDRKAHLAYSVKLPNADGVNYSTGMYLLMKAQSISDFTSALSRQLIPRWNFLVSDESNIFWVHNAVVARRPDGYDWTKPIEGWTGDTEWGTYLPFADNPQILNPPSGFLQNCNNPPWLVTKNSGLDPSKPASYYLQRTATTHMASEALLNLRGERLLQILSGNTRFSVDDMKSLAFDTYVMSADVIVPLLQEAYTGMFSMWPFGESDRVSHVLESLRQWDRRSSTDSIAFTYLYFWGKAYETLYPSSFGRFTEYERRNIDIHSWLERYRARRALELALTELEKFFGTTEVPWGKVNVTVRGEEFPLGGNGLFDVLHPDAGVEKTNGQIVDNDGWGHIMIVVEGTPKKIWTLLPYGESEHPSSAHFNDQAKLHSRCELKQFWFYSQDILNHTESVWGDRNRLARHFRSHKPDRLLKLANN